MEELRKKRMSGIYLPPAKLKMLQDGIVDKSSEEYQRLSWETLKKSINGLVNKCNSSNLPVIVRELLKENLIRGSGILCQSLLTAQAFGPIFSNVYSALVAVINTKLPQIGKILLSRLIIRFKKSYIRDEKQSCINAVRFLAHLINQDVVHELLGLEILTLLVENATDDSVEIAVAFLKECGAKLVQTCPKGSLIIFDMLRHILNEGKLDTRTQYAIEVISELRKDGFKDYPIVIPELDLLEEGDKITHEFELDDMLETDDHLNVFRFDPDYLENEKKYSILKKEVLDESDSDDGEDDDEDADEDDEDEDEDEEEGENKIIDETATDLVSLRRKLYLTLQSSVQPEEAAHKLMKLQLEGKERAEMCFTIIDCCAQQRTYIKFYGLIAQNFCALGNEYVTTFSSVFVDCFSKIHRFQDPIKLRNVAKFFAHLLFTDSIPWTVLSVIKLNEDDTTSASRVFIKHLFQEIADFMGIYKFEARIKDPTLQEAFSGIFPRDNPRDSRFSIVFFSQIGLGPLTEDLREFLMAKPVPEAEVTIKEEPVDEKPVVEKKSHKRKREASSSDSSSDSNSDSDSDSSTESDSESDSSSSSSDSEDSSSSSSDTETSSDSDESSGPPSPPSRSRSRSRSKRASKHSSSKDRDRKSKSNGRSKRKEDVRREEKRKDERKSKEKGREERTRTETDRNRHSDHRRKSSSRHHHRDRDNRGDKPERRDDKHPRDSDKSRREDKHRHKER